MIPTLLFGRTGHMSTRVLFGAAALSKVTQAEADKAVETIMEYGVNHIDTAASYGDAELRLGPSIAKYRNKFFLATKTGERTYQAAKDSIQRSLEHLRTDHLDLIQLHGVIEDSEWEVATGAGGALEAAIEARRQGLVRFIGITSHSLHAPIIHQKSLARFDFDSILLPWNYQLAHNPDYAANFQAVVKTARAKIPQCRSSRQPSAVCGVTFLVGLLLGMNRIGIKNLLTWQYFGHYPIQACLSIPPGT